MNTLSRLQHLIKLGFRSLFNQLWSTSEIPSENQLKHNFKDGKGRVNAYPYDKSITDTSITNIELTKLMDQSKDDISTDTSINNIKTKDGSRSGKDNAQADTSITEVKCIPYPIILQIQNEVPDKIDKIIPVKTQALPGQDFVFKIIYVKDYNYMDGDILPSYGVLSTDGSTLTVNSMYDLSIRLILAPAPQDWIPERPDPSIVTPGDRQLRSIPHDGAQADYTIENAELNNYFNVVSMRNNATTFMTVGGGNSTDKTVNIPTSEYTYTLSYAKGYDHDDIVWSCDDPNVTWEYFNYNNKDYNENTHIPADYVKLAYIENTTDCYIDTGVKILSTDVVEAIANIKSSTSTSYKCLFGARQSSFVNNFFVFTRMNSQARACYARCNQEVWASSMTYDTDIKFIADSNSLKILNLDNEILHQIDVTGTACETTPVTCFIFDGNNNGNRDNSKCEGKIYSFKISDNEGNIKYHFIPAKRKSDLLIGLYEVINGTFHPSKSSNTFGYQPVKIDDTRITFSNITKNCVISCKTSSAYDDPIQTEPDEIISTYTIEDSKLTDYFWVVSTTNNATDYVSFDASYKTSLINQNQTFVLTYKTGYDNYDIKCESNTEAEIEIGETFHITYNTLEIPDIYTTVVGIKNTNSNTYFKTNYIPKQGDKIVCYANISSSRYTNPSYLFGARNSVGNGSMVFYGHASSNADIFAYDRCSGEKTLTSRFDQLIKITCTDNNITYENGYEKFSVDTTNTVTNSTYAMYLFGCNNANSRQYPIYGSIYKFTVYDSDDNIKYNFVPVKRTSDNVLGFYDTINKEFITYSGGAVSESEQIIFKGKLTVSNINTDTVITLSKNDGSRKPLEISDNEMIETTYTIEESKLSDYFWVTDTIWNGGSIATRDSQYKTPLVGNNATYAITYKNGNDNTHLTASTNNDATVEFGDVMHIVYNIIPYEYTVINGITNNNSNTYFDTGYKMKATDKIRCYANIYSSYYTYPSYLFGARNGVGTNSVVFYGHASSNRDIFAYDISTGEKTLTGRYGQLLQIDLNGQQLKYTNGYEIFTVNDLIAKDCNYSMYVFGCNNANSRQYPIYGTIYKFTIFDENDIPVVNLIPCIRNVDKVIGFYDTVSDKFLEPKNNGIVTIAPPPSIIGSMVVKNITEDTVITVNEAEKKELILKTDDNVIDDYSIESSILDDWFYVITVKNLTNGEISFSNYTYDKSYVVRKGETLNISTTYQSGYQNTDFIVDTGSLSNTQWSIKNVQKDMTISIMLNDYHDPKMDSDDDLGIFTDPDFSDFNQYKIILGDDSIISSYSFITSQPDATSDREIWSFAKSDIDLYSFNPTDNPGNAVKCMLVCSDGNFNEIVTNVNIDGYDMYRHTVTLKNQFKLENGREYIFKVRNNYDTGKLIAYAKDTNSYNIVNSNNENYIAENQYFMDWNEANKYIVKGNKAIYFEINGIKI